VEFLDMDTDSFELNIVTFPSHTSNALWPFNVFCFKPFKTTFKKERNNVMTKNK
jgi:hypothetical protein